PSGARQRQHRGDHFRIGGQRDGRVDRDADTHRRAAGAHRSSRERLDAPGSLAFVRDVVAGHHSKDDRWERFVVKTALLVVVVAAFVPATAVAQYPLAPSPALDFTKLSPNLTPAGYGAARQTLRSDTNTFSVTQARLTLQMRPVAIAALRMQANFASIDSSTGSTTPSFALTDAYVQLS